jgi:hypothetical protein
MAVWACPWRGKENAAIAEHKEKKSKFLTLAPHRDKRFDFIRLKFSLWDAVEPIE